MMTPWRTYGRWPGKVVSTVCTAILASIFLLGWHVFGSMEARRAEERLQALDAISAPRIKSNLDNNELPSRTALQASASGSAPVQAPKVPTPARSSTSTKALHPKPANSQLVPTIY